MNVLNAALTSDFSAAQAIERIAALQSELIESMRPLEVTTGRFDQDSFCVQGFLQRPGPVRVSPKRLSRLSPVEAKFTPRHFAGIHNADLRRMLAASSVTYVKAHFDNTGAFPQEAYEGLEYFPRDTGPCRINHIDVTPFDALDFEAHWAERQKYSPRLFFCDPDDKNLRHFRILPALLLAGGYTVFLEEPVLPVFRNHLSDVPEILAMSANNRGPLAIPEQDVKIHNIECSALETVLHDLTDLLHASELPLQARRIGYKCALAIFETAQKLGIAVDDDILIELCNLPFFFPDDRDITDISAHFYPDAFEEIENKDAFTALLLKNLELHLGRHHPINRWFANHVGN